MIRLIITGAPRTKKNHGKRIKRGSQIFHVGSDAHRAWEDSAIDQLRKQWKGAEPIGSDVQVSALVYREKRIGDLVGYLQAIGDALELGKPTRPKGGVIVNDKQIVSWDGSRPLWDKKNPRIELEIVPMEDESTVRPHPFMVALERTVRSDLRDAEREIRGAKRK